MIALGNGQFSRRRHQRRLAGRRLEAGRAAFLAQGRRDGDVVKLPTLDPSRKCSAFSGTIAGETMTIGDRDGKANWN